MTKQVNIEAHPKDLTTEMLQFLEKNFRAFPGKATLRFTLSEPRNKMRISLVGMSGGIEMNEELIQFLEQKPELEVQVQSV